MKNEEQIQEEPIQETQETVEKQEEEMDQEPVSETDALKAQIAELQSQVADLQDLKVRQMAEFDNFRRRTNKEKLALMETAGEKIFTEMLPLVDDFERAIQAMKQTDDIDSLREGINLIYNKFVDFLNKHEVRAMDTTDADFDTDKHEAITTFAAGEDKKGKIIDCTQKGYTLSDKVIRFAKVVVGE